MINATSSGMSMPPPPKSSVEESLTDEQQSLISETLSNFDADNLSESDAASIVKTLSEAGIQPSAAFEQAMADVGFDAKTIGDLAGISEEGNRPPPPPPPPQQSAEEITSMVDYLSELMEEKLAESSSDSLSAEDKESILAQVFEKYNIEDGESIINTTA